MKLIIALSLVACAVSYQPFYNSEDLFEREHWLRTPFTTPFNIRTPFWNQRDRFLGLTTGFRGLTGMGYAYQPFYDHEDLFEREHWLHTPFTTPFNIRTPVWNQRDRFLGLTTGFRGFTEMGYGTPFLHRDHELDMVKTKLVHSAPIDRVDFEIVRHKISYVPENDIDEIEKIVKSKITHGVPVQRFEAAILKECVKAKVARGIPIDKLESEVLKEVVKAKVMRGIPVDKLEAKVCANNIKNKLVKGRSVDPLDLEILIDFVKNKIARNREPTNLECEVVIEALKHKVIFLGVPLDPIEGEVLVECIKNKARRGSPISRKEEDLLLMVVQNKPFTGLPIDRKEMEIVHEISKNKMERGEGYGHFGLNTMLPLRTPTTLPLHRHQMLDMGMTYGRGLHGMNMWNRCPTTGFYDLFHDNLFTTGRMYRNPWTRFNMPFTAMHY